MAQAGTPAERLKFLSKKFEEVVKTAEFQKFAKAQLFHENSLMVGEELERWVQGEYQKISQLLDEFGLRKK